MGNLFWFLILLSVIVAVNGQPSTIAPNLKNFPWCGGRLNPLETAKTGRVATAVLFSCKEATQRLNISSGFLKETDRICAVWRLCYSVGEDASNATTEIYKVAGECTYKLSHAATFLFPTWTEKYNINMGFFADALQRCAFPKFPKGVNYVLKTIDYFRYFASG
ncbi:uncharacterized protein LOC142574132 isoform X1 [Dermacentor variabilis]|uniref:uncharacterized protein LOC142574132 isoform X1 n=1 Tax=Dermacentor variabilis TaxID=34621 RepID=UPI003F5AE6E1